MCTLLRQVWHRDKTYTIAAGNEAKYFTLNAASGVLSLRAAAPEGFYTLTVQAADEDDNQAKAVATVDVWVALSLAEVRYWWHSPG